MIQVVKLDQIWFKQILRETHFIIIAGGSRIPVVRNVLGKVVQQNVFKGKRQFAYSVQKGTTSERRNHGKEEGGVPCAFKKEIQKDKKERVKINGN